MLMHASDVTSHTSSGLEVLGKECTSLRALNLRYCFQINDDFCKAIGAVLGNLESLKLGACTKVTNAGIAAIAKGCKGLEVLDLYYCKKVTAEGIVCIAKHCSRVKELNLRGLADLQGVQFVETLVSCCTLLKTLNLRGVEQASDEWLHVLGKAKNLTGLDLSMCKGVSDEMKKGLFADGVVRALV